ncbi:MAG: 4-hydroxyphenylpyruvate dioxygenase [Nostocaceae cyanobacterium]|nr:4-hydroxyphenylpyruvate dioxygenase [Nostocaceae cyanobacterium]
MKIDRIHFYVENAKFWRDWFVHHLGFQPIPTSTNLPHTCTELVKSGSVCFLLSSPLSSQSPVAKFLRQHPPGVADVAFTVENVEAAIALAQLRNAQIIQPVQQYHDGSKTIKWCQIAGWGSLTHTLIERNIHQITNNSSISKSIESPFTAIDHVVLNVEAGDLKHAVAWYENIFDFQPQQTFNIQTEYSGLHSQVMVSPNRSVQLPINEPTSSNSQIQEFLNANQGSGIQHIALRTSNLVSAITKFRAAGLSLLPPPPSYYSLLPQRPGFNLSLEELRAIAQQEILVDWNQDAPEATLLQIFTQPIFPQPTFFLEFIERRSQATGFGEGNFRALFTAMEQEQIKRTSLQYS